MSSRLQALLIGLIGVCTPTLNAYTGNCYSVLPHGRTIISYCAGHGGGADAMRYHALAAWLEQERQRLVGEKKLNDMDLEVYISDFARAGGGPNNQFRCEASARKEKEGATALIMSWGDLPDLRYLALGLQKAADKQISSSHPVEYIIREDPESWKRALEPLGGSREIKFWDLDLNGRKAGLYWTPSSGLSTFHFEDSTPSVRASGEGFLEPPLLSPDGQYLAFASQKLIQVSSVDFSRTWMYSINPSEDLEFRGGIAMAFSKGSSRLYFGTKKDGQKALKLPLEQAELIDFSDVEKRPAAFPKPGKSDKDLRYKYEGMGSQ
jgi:hypothetical protein